MNLVFNFALKGTTICILCIYSVFGNESVANDAHATLDVSEDKTVQIAQQADENTVLVAQQLAEQREKLTNAYQVEDAFSLTLAELYFDYARLLMQVNELGEAEKALDSALHIQKVNHGLQAPELKPILFIAFDLHFAQRNLSDLENVMSRLLWFARQTKTEDAEIYSRVLKMGHYYLSLFRAAPRATTENLDLLRKAKRYFVHAIGLRKESKLSDDLPPYGELALAYFFEGSIVEVVGAQSLYAVAGGRQKGVSSRSLAGRETNHLKSQSVNLGVRTLRKYLERSRKEGSVVNTVHALLGLGDFYLMVNRPTESGQFYRFAWEEAQKLDESEREALDLSSPVKLPAFNYTIQPIQPAFKKEVVAVPMSFTVATNGRVRDVVKLSKEHEYFPYYLKAAKRLRKLSFRPALVDGHLVESQQITKEIKVFANKKRTDTTK